MKELIYTVMVFFVSKTAFPQSYIFTIARSGTVEDINEFVKENSNVVNQTNKKGETPLILACCKGNNEVAVYLMNVVKDINASSEAGTALMVCAVKGNTAIAKLLLERKADPNVKDDYGNTALILAVQFKNIELVKLLLKYNADKTQKDGLGKTAFEYAAFSNDRVLTHLLG